MEWGGGGGDDKEHCCRVCGKCFPCGRSLGGHMRSHLSPIPSSSTEIARKKKMTGRDCSNGSGSSSGCCSISSGSRTFTELRACYGALRREPQRSRRLSEPAAVPRRAAATRRRSRRVASIASAAAASSASSEYLDEEEEDVDVDVDVAICLMMLSRDSLGKHNSASKHGGGAAKDAEFDHDLSSVVVSERGPAEKRARFACPECSKPFRSYQALGGHRANRKRINGGCCSSKIHFPDDSFGADASFEPARKAREHQCPICDKVFGSGQALGGHKRSHLMMASSSDRRTRIGSVNNDSSATENKSSTSHELLDLNLPAPVDGASSDGNGNVEYKPWWNIEGDHKHESLVGFI